MSFLLCFFILAVVVVIQYLTPFSMATQNRLFLNKVIDFIISVLHDKIKLNEWLCVIAILLPVMGVAFTLMALVSWIFSSIGTMIVMGVVLWLFVDIKAGDQTEPKMMLVNRFCRCFAPILWFIIFGLEGFVFYIVCYQMTQVDSLGDNFQFLVRKIVAYLNWIPERVLGISLSLVGFFNQGFKVWLKGLVAATGTEYQLLLKCAMASLDTRQREEDHVLKSLDELLLRALVLWMMVLALIAFGVMLG